MATKSNVLSTTENNSLQNRDQLLSILLYASPHSATCLLDNITLSLLHDGLVELRFLVVCFVAVLVKIGSCIFKLDQWRRN